MALIQPDYLQSGSYSAAELRYSALQPVVQEGIVGSADFAVAQRAAGANMSVDVAAGNCYVQGDSVTRQGLYFVANDAVVNVSIPTANGSNPRIDQVVCHVYDTTAIGGSSNLAVLEVVQGTATAGATLANRNGAAALPATALKLADVLVPTSAASIVTANIGNLRDPRAGTTGYPAVTATLSIAGAPTQFALGKPVGYIPAAKSTLSGASPANAAAIINWGSNESWDTDAIHDTATNPSRFTCKTPGFYSVKASAKLTTTAGSDTIFSWLYVNGALTTTGSGPAVGSTSLAGDYVGTNVVDTLRLGYGDYVEFQVYTNAANTMLSQLEMEWIGP